MLLKKNFFFFVLLFSHEISFLLLLKPKYQTQLVERPNFKRHPHIAKAFSSAKNMYKHGKHQRRLFFFWGGGVKVIQPNQPKLRFFICPLGKKWQLICIFHLFRPIFGFSNNCSYFNSIRSICKSIYQASFDHVKVGPTPVLALHNLWHKFLHFFLKVVLYKNKLFFLLYKLETTFQNSFL